MSGKLIGYSWVSSQNNGVRVISRIATYTLELKGNAEKKTTILVNNLVLSLKKKSYLVVGSVLLLFPHS